MCGLLRLLEEGHIVWAGGEPESVEIELSEISKLQRGTSDKQSSSTARHSARWEGIIGSSR